MIEIKIKREDRKRAEQLLALAGIKVYKPQGMVRWQSNAGHDFKFWIASQEPQSEGRSGE